MADITAGLPKLRPEELQAQQDRARIEALGGAISTGARQLGAAATDIGSLPVRAILGAGNTLLRVPNAFGANIPYAADNGMLSSMTPFSDRLNAAAPALPAMTAPVPTAAAGAPAGGRNLAGAATEPQAPDQAPVQVATTSRAPKSGGTKTAGGMPAGAPAPVAAPALIPGETGFYMNDQLVPYGTLFNASGDGRVSRVDGGGNMMAGLPGGGKMINGRFADPRDALEYGFRLQSQYRDDSIRAILENAGSGAELGYRARVAALANAFGANNFGQTSVGGANALNQAIAHITGAEVGAGATIGAAKIGLQGREAEIAAQRELHATDSVPTGTVLGSDPLTHMAVPLTTYGQRPTKAGAMPLSYTEQAPKPKEGATGKTPDGRAVVYKNGEWQPATK